MGTFLKKVLLLSIVLTAVYVCSISSQEAYGVSQSSSKTKAEKLYNNKNAKNDTISKYKVASRSYSTTIGSADVNSVISYAKKYIGAKYVFGASGPSSFDCSGFTMYVMNSFCIELPHSASGQSLYGINVSKTNLIIGDFVFFNTYGGSGVSHVGIYIGGGNFIHASLNGVVISNLNEGYYKTRYITAKRIIK